jgi:hypothetical protein
MQEGIITTETLVKTGENMANKISVTFRIPKEMLTTIDKIVEEKKIDRTAVFLKMLSQSTEYKKAVEFLLVLFQENSPNLEISEEQKFQAMKIVEMLNND